MIPLATFNIQPFDDTGYYIAGDFEEWANAEWGAGEWDVVGDPFWMCIVPFPEDYESREEWEQSLDFVDPVWSGCRPPQDGQETKSCRRFIHVVLKKLDF